jgi:hypothetical protein
MSSDIEKHDSYRLRTVGTGIASLNHLPPFPIITFTSTDPSLPLPNPEYLKLHAAVCRVAHMSGAADYLDQEDRDVDRVGVLARDGSSANLLASRLQYVTLKAWPNLVMHMHGESVTVCTTLSMCNQCNWCPYAMVAQCANHQQREPSRENWHPSLPLYC